MDYSGEFQPEKLNNSDLVAYDFYDELLRTPCSSTGIGIGTVEAILLGSWGARSTGLV